jgi:hypothetical protein
VVPDRRDRVRIDVVPRPGSGTRRLARLDAVDASRYRSLVAPLAPLIERSLTPDVLANRAVGRGAHATVRLEDWRRARLAWSRRAEAGLVARSTRAVVVSDVAACYPSIEPGVVGRRLRASGASRHDAGRIEAFLRELGERGVDGLPVGPSASALLANLVLVPADERLREAGIRHLRWVDDVVMFARGRQEALRGLDAWRRALEDLGLRANPRKTSLVLDPGHARSRVRGDGSSSAGHVSACDDAAP